MANKIKDVEVSTRAAPFVDLQAAVTGALSATAVRAVGLQRAIAETSEGLARKMFDAAARNNRDISQMTLDALSQGDPIALMTLGPRAAQTSLRAAMDCANLALESAQALGKTMSSGPPPTPDRA